MSDNIQVVVRCRARNTQESSAKSPVVVELATDTFAAGECFVTVLNEASSFLPAKTSSAAASKVFKVDQVYGPGADQSLVFDNVAAPLFADFVAGLNVTLLAYGQTGSGKTHTMFGDLRGDNAGIIPRVLSQLFDETANVDCSIKISCVELYKEELNDLINNDLDLLPVKTKLRLVSEPSRDMGVASVQNLTELTIDSSEMGFHVLQKCLGKRRTASTKLNDQSSRSHTIFSIILHQKTGDGAENSTYRVSKMNFVDLAGSEDINKSGALHERAREAGSINQSLLTLGKVISSLSEGKETRHIPYRESKLTRLLQGSIGGKTKTALIATVSPAKVNVHETLSTLTYASKAKSIKNLPQSTQNSQNVLKKVLVKDLSSQIARLTRDLLASKDKEGGIKMSLQNYQSYGESIQELESSVLEKSSEITRLSQKLESKSAEAESLKERLEMMEKNSTAMEARFTEQSAQLSKLSSDLIKLTEQHSSQNKKVSSILQSNITEVTNALDLTIRDISFGGSQTESMLSSASASLVSTLENSRISLKKKADQLNTFLLEKAQLELSDLLQRSLDVSTQLDLIRNCKLDKSVSDLNSNRHNLQNQLKSEASQDLLQEILMDSAREIRENKLAMERKMIQNISESLRVVLAENENSERKTLESVAKRISDSTQKRMLKVVESSSTEHKELVDHIQNKAQEMSKNIATMGNHLEKGRGSVSQTFQDHLHSLLHDSSEELFKTTFVDTSCSVKALNETFNRVSSKIKDTDAEVVSRLRTTNTNVGEIAAKIETLRNNSSTHSSHKLSPVQSPSMSPAAKRRKPMSPMKSDNILYRSRIPQLGPTKIRPDK